jgi:hypothetical protein
MTKISVVTVSNRPGGIDLQWSALRKQTVDFEWVLCDTLADKRGEVLKDFSNNDKRIKHIQQNRPKQGSVTGLAQAENQALRATTGDMIVMLQDYIWIAPDCLEKYLFHYENTKGKALVTGVGDIYGKPGKDDIKDNQGLLTVFDKPFTGKPEVVTWHDPRRRTDQGTFYKCYPNYIEFNFCMVQWKCLGGLDEEYDMVGHAWDNVNVAQRASMLGYETYIDQTNECRGLDHDYFWPNKVKIDQQSYPIGEFHLRRMATIQTGIFPIKLDYIKPRDYNYSEVELQ